MSKEDQLKRYAEDRLSALADGEDSLARLKEAQTANAPERKATPWRRYVRTIATSFAVLIVAVTGVLFAVRAFTESGGDADGVEKGAVNGLFPNAAHSVPSYDAVIEGKGQLEADGGVNAETEYVKVTLPSNAFIDRVKAETGYYYTLSLKDGSFDAIVAFDGATPDGTSFETEKETTVAGASFSYVWAQDISLRGKLVTARETIYITHCAGADEADALRIVRTILTEK